MSAYFKIPFDFFINEESIPFLKKEENLLLIPGKTGCEDTSHMIKEHKN
jgi:hypothetical protein